MSRFKWHITRLNEKPKIIRHYKHVNRMFDFVSRNPSMFRNRWLEIYNHGELVTRINWSKVIELKNRRLKERELRNIIRGLDEHGTPRRKIKTGDERVLIR